MKYSLWTGIVAVFLSPGFGSAAFVTAKLTSVSPGVGVTIYESSIGNVGTTAGIFNWTQTDNSTLQSSFKTFCIEIGQHVGIGGTYKYTLDSDIQNYPDSGIGAGAGAGTSGAMGDVKAKLLRELFGRYYDTLDSTNVMNAAFQLAIWEITHDGYSTAIPGQYYSGNLFGTGDFKLINPSTNAIAAKSLAKTWLMSLNGDGPMKNGLIVLTSDCYQDQITVGPEPEITAVPAPPAIGLAVVGFAAMFGWKRSRRKGELSSPSVG